MQSRRALSPFLQFDAAALPAMVAPLLDAERERAERLLNALRAVVVPLCALTAFVYAPRISPELNRVNLAVLLPLMLWTLLQYPLFYRGVRPVPRYLRRLGPAIDVTAVSLILLGYGLASSPALALKAPVWVVYFAILAARPMTGSSRHAAATSALVVLEYAAVSVALMATGRAPLSFDPILAAHSGTVSPLDEASKVLFLIMAGVVATYATAWHERLLRRALEAQVGRDHEERDLVVRLQEADKLAALGTLAASVAHEVNNPLSTIAGTAELLRLELTDELQRRDAESIAAEARRTSRVVHDLLAFARPRASSLGEVSVSDVAARALETLRLLLRDHRVTVERTLRDEVPVRYGDPDALERVVLNLVINAVQALEGRDGERIVCVSTGRDRDDVWLAVEDNGPGLPAHAEHRIFDRFFTTKPAGKGTGLGLWIVRQIVEAHNGTIAASNGSNGGARFVVRLRDHAPPSLTPPMGMAAVGR